MGKRILVDGIALLTLIGLLLSACGPQLTPTPTETSVPPETSTPEPSPSPTAVGPTPPPGEASPIVVQRTPEAGAEMPPDGAIELVFDRAMNRASVEAALQISPRVTGSVEWADERTVRFKPARDLKRAEAYQVTVGSQARAADGKALADDYRFDVHTVGYLDVSQVVPAPGTVDVQVESTITVMFNRPVVPLTAISDPAYEGLPQPLALDPPVGGDGEWINTSIYAFTPDGPLAGGTTYTARIEAGLTDTTGGLLEETTSWQFTTQVPQVTWVSPRRDEELISVEPTVRIAFNMPVDPASAEEAFSLQGGGAVVDGVVEVVSETLIFTPTEQLAFDTLYTARVDAGVVSLRGGEGMPSAYEWRFTTVPLPRIIGTRPSDGQQDANPHHPFEIMFNTRIDPTTVMPNVEMTPPLSPTRVFTHFSSYDNVFRIDFGSQPSTDYEVRIGPDISDPYGNTTGQALTVSYRTAPLDPAVQLDVPGTIGTYNASQPAQILVGHLNVERFDLRLGRLDPGAYADVQDRFWESQLPADLSLEALRSWSVDVEAPLNEKRHAPVELAEGGTLEPGLYLLEVRAPGVSFEPWVHRRLLAVSDYNLTIKSSGDRVWVWATELESGQPVSGLQLLAKQPDMEPVGPVTSDEDGLAQFNLSARAQRLSYVVSEAPFVLGSMGWEWEQGISPWAFGLQGGYDEREYRVHITTDRPLYRAGQTVHFRGVVRKEDDVDYSLPGEKKVRVQVTSAEGEEVFRQELALDAYGAFHGALALGEGAALGDYQVRVTVGGVGYGATFTVAAYRPPEFEVTVTPEEEELAAGQGTQADVEVRYFFGGAVADADVEWRVLSTPYRFAPQQFGRYDFTDDDDPWICRWCWWQPMPSPRVILEGSGTTDAEGHLTVGLPTEVMTGGQKLTIEATVYGKDGQAIAGREDMIVHRGDFYVGLAPQQQVGEAGEEMTVDVVTVDWDGQRVPNQALDVEVYRREWINTFVENEGGGGRWEWETEDTLIHTDTIATDQNAQGDFSFTPEEGGSYRVVAQGGDTPYDIRTSTWVWVSGGDVSWRRENNDRFDLISDKATYVPGETAEILIPSPFQGEQWAWITVERGDVLQQEVRRLESSSAIYRLPITAEHAPNVYVSVVIVKGPDATNPAATHKVGILPLTVEPVEQTLDIRIEKSPDSAQPGETVSFDLQVRDASGEPVQASFSLDLVDKAVLSLKPRQDDAIVEAFYGRRGIGVSTSSGLVVSINRILLKQIEELEDLARQGLGIGGGGADEALEEEAPAAAPAREAASKSAEGLPPGIQVREQFEDTAFWEAGVVTDEQGQASVEVELPDNLTTWVFRGVGVTKDTKVGDETTELLVTKPLLVRPVAPRFFVVGDRAQLAALVSNNTGSEQDVEVTLKADGLTVDGEATQQVRIADGAEGKVTWWVEAEDVPYADVVMGAVAGDYADAARPRLTTGPEGTLLVHRYTAPEIVGTGGQLADEGARVEAIALPPNASDRKGELSLRLDPSLAAGMTEGLDYLEHYPYECTEQIVSRFLPNVLTYRAMRELGLSKPELEQRLPDLVAGALEKLNNRQNEDGGWGWWEKGESRVHLTAYVIFGMVEARRAGFEVQEEVVDRGLSYLRGQLVSGRELVSYREANQQAFVLYVMAEAGDTGRASEHTGDLYQHRDKLSHYGRAFLAMTLHLIGEQGGASGGPIDTLLSDLQNDAILSATGAHWEEEGYDFWAMNTDTRSTAVILDALARLDPENDLIPNVVRWLMVARRDGIWETTYETSWALIALTDWMRVTGELRGNYNYAVWLNDQLLEDGRVTPETVDESTRRQVPVADLLTETSNRLAIGRGAGEGRLYYTAHLRTFLPVEEIEPLNRGVIVSRQYSDPTCSEGVQCPEVEGAEVGEVVQVRLTIIAPHDLTYVVVEDPLPAGAEPIDPTLATTSLVEQQPTLFRQADSDYGREFYRWWWSWYSRSEMRDDKIVLFADYLPAGTYEYTYTFRATRPGEYHVIPTSAREFYFPEVFGRGAGRLFSVQAGE